jgi:hypothetical protein
MNPNQGDDRSFSITTFHYRGAETTDEELASPEACECRPVGCAIVCTPLCIWTVALSDTSVSVYNSNYAGSRNTE